MCVPLLESGRRRLFALAGILAIVSVCLMACPLKGEEIASLFRTEGLSQLAKLESHLCQLQGSVVMQSGHAQDLESYHVRLRNDCFLVTTLPSPKGGEEKVLGKNSKYFFRIGRKSQSDRFLIFGCGKQLSKEEAMLNQELLGNSILAPVRVVGRSLQEWIEDEHFALKDITLKSGADGRTFVEAKVAYITDKDTVIPQLPAFTGRIELDPHRNWGIVRQSLILQRRYKGEIVATVPVETAVDFGPNLDGLPVPQVVTLAIRSPQDLNVYRYRRTCTMTNLSRCNLSEREFTLSKFGLPEPGGVEWPQPIPLYAWVSAAGFLLLVAAAFIYLLRNRVLTRTSRQ